MPGDQQGQDLREALKTVAATLKDGDFGFALAGGYAAWARGGPEPDHDVDYLVDASDVERAKSYLTERGLRVEQPPEDWLFKAFVGDAMVDLIHHLGPEPVDAALLQRSDVLEVFSIRMPVISATDLVKQKLRVLDEHHCDFSSLLPTARALREQVDWSDVRQAAKRNDYAAAFVFLAERLGIASRGVGSDG